MTTETGKAPISRYSRTIGFVLAGYWILLFISTHIPLSPVKGLPQHSDKPIHSFAYMVLSYLLMLWLSAGRPEVRGRYLLALAITFGYGILDELLQFPLKSRTPDFFDLFADWIGSLTGVAGFALTRLTFRQWWTVTGEPPS
jgi:VanZ family protein